MTLGGSLFPGALGAMLIEVLPFMRDVASDIRDALGDDNPAVVPTVMVAYSLSSFLIGIIFLVLGALGLGRFVSNRSCRASSLPPKQVFGLTMLLLIDSVLPPDCAYRCHRWYRRLALYFRPRAPLAPWPHSDTLERWVSALQRGARPAPGVLASSDHLHVRLSAVGCAEQADERGRPISLLRSHILPCHVGSVLDHSRRPGNR